MFKKLLKKSKVKTEDVVRDLDKLNQDLLANNQKTIDELRRMQK